MKVDHAEAADGPRRRRTVMALAVLALAAAMTPRIAEGRPTQLLVEGLGIVAVLGWVYRRAMGWSAVGRIAGGIGVAGVPVVAAVVCQWLRVPTPNELVMLTFVGTLAVGIAVASGGERTRRASLVLGGFLTIFAAAVIDDGVAAAWPLAWMSGAVWYLVTCHWSRLETRMPQSVTTRATIRPRLMNSSTAVLATIVALVGGWAVAGRAGPVRNLAWQIMPTSGGNGGTDPAARSGVGDGDAAVAAQDHADSFGAVESDLFLESKQKSLFDMASDFFGEPRVEKRRQKREAVGGNVQMSHRKEPRSERGGDAFETARRPPRRHRHLDDAPEEAVVQWVGPTGIRLGVDRFDAFDGRTWTKSGGNVIETPTPQDRLPAVVENGRTWFFDPVAVPPRRPAAGLPPGRSDHVLKVVRLSGVRVPAPMGTEAVHCKDITRYDFFNLAGDGGWAMPDLETIPPLTVIHQCVRTIDEEERHAAVTGRRTGDGVPEVSGLGESVAALVDEASSEEQAPLDRLDAAVERLRSGTVDRTAAIDGDVPVVEFLRDRRGGDYLFATAAAMAARHLGFDSRLVVGLYVRPDSVDASAGHAAVAPSDVHVWAEYSCGDGRWYELEPSPGYRPPAYRVGWRLWATRWLRANARVIGVVGGAAVLLFLTRVWWIDALLTLLWRAARWLPDRRRVRLAMTVLAIRGRLAGWRRPAGVTRRAWWTGRPGGESVRRFFDAADASCFGLRREPIPESTFAAVGRWTARRMRRRDESATATYAGAPGVIATNLPVNSEAIA